MDKDVAGFERCDGMRGKERAAPPWRTEAESLSLSRCTRCSAFNFSKSFHIRDFIFIPAVTRGAREACWVIENKRKGENNV